MQSLPLISLAFVACLTSAIRISIPQNAFSGSTTDKTPSSTGTDEKTITAPELSSLSMTGLPHTMFTRTTCGHPSESADCTTYVIDPFSLPQPPLGPNHLDPEHSSPFMGSGVASTPAINSKPSTVSHDKPSGWTTQKNKTHTHWSEWTSESHTAPLWSTSTSTIVPTKANVLERQPLPTVYEPQCSGDMDSLYLEHVCNTDFVLPITGTDCQTWCECDDKGKINCPSPATGCKDTGLVTDVCTSGVDDFTCKCQPVEEQPSSAKQLTEVTNVPVSTTNLIERDASTEDTFMFCHGPDMKTYDSLANCVLGNLMWSGNDCSAHCKCHNSGKLTCNYPSFCHPTTNIDKHCSSNSKFQCDCLTTQKTPEALVPKDASNEDVLMFCHGPDMKTEDIAGTCMDGNFLMWSGNDCSAYCKCDDSGKLTCNHPSDCGPTSTVLEYCSSNSRFQCDCLAKEKREDLVSRDTATPEIVSFSKDRMAVADRSIDTIASMTCTGADLKTSGIAGTCMDGNFLYYSGQDCADHCTCKAGGISCSHPSDCGPTKDVNAYCAIGPNFTCQCPF